MSRPVAGNVCNLSASPGSPLRQLVITAEAGVRVFYAVERLAWIVVAVCRKGAHGLVARVALHGQTARVANDASQIRGGAPGTDRKTERKDAVASGLLSVLTPEK